MKPELAVPCPVCHAPIGKPCNLTRPRHRNGERPNVHRGRLRALELEQRSAEQLRLSYQVEMPLGSDVDVVRRGLP